MRRFAAVAAALAAMLAASPGRAADASPWDGDARSAARLVAGIPTRGDGTPLRAGVEIRLAPGWKTYWRYPGDSGVPPIFDFARSSNVASATVSWPAPHRFSDGSGQSIGYDHSVLFPVRVVARNPAEPLTLRLKLDYAVCEKLCVPSEAALELEMAVPSPGSAANEAALAAAEARVPTPSTIGAHADLAITSVRREPGARFARVVVDVAAPPGETVDLFAEGPTPEWALPLPMPVAGGPAGAQRFAFDLDGIPAGVNAAGATLTLTAVAPRSAIEVKAPVE
jgi:DsbC/DsbD-like thiol-disulfide interchange protein